MDSIDGNSVVRSWSRSMVTLDAMLQGRRDMINEGHFLGGWAWAVGMGTKTDQHQMPPDCWTWWACSQENAFRAERPFARSPLNPSSWMHAVPTEYLPSYYSVGKSPLLAITKEHGKLLSSGLRARSPQSSSLAHNYGW